LRILDLNLKSQISNLKFQIQNPQSKIQNSRDPAMIVRHCMPQHPPIPGEVCALCGRLVPASLITLHHLLPKQKGGRADHRVPLCKPCHKQIHATFGNTDLARLYTSVEALRAAPQLQPFLKWIRKQKPDRVFRTITSNDHPRSKKQRWRP
jgi:hypothetical protein